MPHQMQVYSWAHTSNFIPDRACLFSYSFFEPSDVFPGTIKRKDYNVGNIWPSQKLRVKKLCIDQLGSFIPISSLHIHLLLLQYFVQTFIKWNSGQIRCFDFFKQKVFDIREKSKIHNVTIFSPANLERLDISLSINMLQKSLFNPRHDLREKWLELIHQK